MNTRHANRTALAEAEARVARERIELQQACGHWLEHQCAVAVSLRGLTLAVLAGFVTERLLVRRWSAPPPSPPPPAGGGRLMKLLGLGLSLWQMLAPPPRAGLAGLLERLIPRGGGARRQ